MREVGGRVGVASAEQVLTVGQASVLYTNSFHSRLGKDMQMRENEHGSMAAAPASLKLSAVKRTYKHHAIALIYQALRNSP